MKKNLLILTLLATAAFIATGCSKQSSGATPAASKPAAAVQPAGPAATGAKDTDIFGG